MPGEVLGQVDRAERGTAVEERKAADIPAQQASQPEGLLALPAEVLADILARLDPADLVRLSAVSHGAAEHAVDGRLWRQVLASFTGAHVAEAAAKMVAWAQSVDPSTNPKAVSLFLQQLAGHLQQEITSENRQVEVCDEVELNAALDNSNIAVIIVTGGVAEIADHRGKLIQVHDAPVFAILRAHLSEVHGGSVTAKGFAGVGEVHGGDAYVFDKAHIENVHSGTATASDHARIEHIHGGRVFASHHAHIEHIHGGTVFASHHVQIDQVSGGLVHATGDATITVGSGEARLGDDGRIYLGDRLLVTGWEEAEPIPSGVTVFATADRQLFPGAPPSSPPPLVPDEATTGDQD